MSDGDRGSSPSRIGLPDGHSSPRPNACPGAALHITADEFRDLARGGQIWATKAHDIEPHGRFPARVYCNAEVQTKMDRGYEVVYGLCASCSEAESNQRRDLRDKAAMQSGRRER